jgi:hypothetical protein
LTGRPGTPRHLGSIAGVSGILGYPLSLVMTAEFKAKSRRDDLAPAFAVTN